MIWFNDVIPTLEMLNQSGTNTLVSHIDIRIDAIDENSITGSMPVDERTRQPYGILHGGATVVLAETLGSIAAAFCVDLTKHNVVGLDINANHIRSVRSGRVSATATPVHIGRRTQVWSIDQVDEQQRRVALSRLTMAIIEHKPS